MKRFISICMLLLLAVGAYAQDKGYVCTGNNVNVRKGPGLNYPVYDVEFGHKRQLMKGDVVTNCGKKKNGFCLIDGPREWGGDERDGWVSAQYLRPVIICPVCYGTKLENISEDEIDLIDCRKCKGKGFIRYVK